MKTGLEEFLKRIEAKPTNETLIDRFMTLVLEEEGIDRILYLKSLVGLLLKTNPYAALKAAYVELQEARKEKLSNEYELGALKDVESCFINLGKAENAALVREEISKMQSESGRPAVAVPMMPRPSQKPINEPKEFGSLPDDERGLVPLPKAERTQIVPPPWQNTAVGELPRGPEPGPARQGMELKPKPLFAGNEIKAAKDEREAKGASPGAKEGDRSAPLSVPQAVPAAAASNAYSSSYVEEDIYTAPADVKEKNLEKERVKAEAAQEASFSIAVVPPAYGNPAPSVSAPAPSAFSLASDDVLPYVAADSYEEAAPPTALRNDKAVDDGEDVFDFGLEYTKRGNAQGDAEPAKAKSSQGADFSLKDGPDKADDFISISSEIDEEFEAQPFFQPDDEDDTELPAAERTMLISLEKLNESQEQIDLAASASVEVKYPVNSGPNFVVLDSDDDLPLATEIEAHERTSLALAAADALPSAHTPGPFALGDSDEAPADFDPDNISASASYSPAAFAFEDAAPPSASQGVSDLGRPLDAESAPDVASAPGIAIEPKPVVVVAAVAAPTPMVTEASAEALDPSQSKASLASSDAMTAERASAPAEAAAPSAEPKRTQAEAFAVDDLFAAEEASHEAESAPAAAEHVKTLPFEDDEVPLREEQEIQHISLVPTASIVQKWTLVQERFKLLSGLQIGRSHALDFVKRLLSAKTETPLVARTLNLLLQFVEAKLDRPLCDRISAWLFEELNPQSMHQLWESLNLKEEGLELYIAHISSLERTFQFRRSLSIMRDILRFELDDSWYSESYPHLQAAWDHLGLEGWIWLDEEGGASFCDRLARREDPLLATLLI